MNKKAQPTDIKTIIFGIIGFIALCFLVIWAVSGSGSTDANTIVGGAWYLIKLGVMFLLIIVAIIILAILIKKAKE